MGRSLILAMTAVVAAFLLAAAFTQLGMARIEDEVVGIRTNAMPSVVELVRARGDFLRVATRLHRRMPPEDLEAINEARQDARQALNRYSDLPTYPGEMELYDKARDQSRALDAQIDRFLALEDKRPGSVTERDFAANRAALERVDDALVAAIMLNTQHLATHTLEIEDAWRRSMHLALALGSVCVMVALIATLVATRAIRGYARLMELRAHELEEFAGRVAHDVISPLTNVGFAITMLQDRRVGESRAKELAGRAMSSLTRVGALVEGLLDFARAGARPVPGARTDVRPVVDGVMAEMLDQASRAEISLTVGPVPDVEVACSAGVLTSILSNLVRNAIRHMGQRPVREIRIHLLTRKERVRFVVSDTGPGLAPEVHKTIFQPYVRGPGARGGGIGLGLATVKRLADAHGGAVGVRSAPGEGAVFWFELPLMGKPEVQGERVLTSSESWA